MTTSPRPAARRATATDDGELDSELDELAKDLASVRPLTARELLFGRLGE